MDTSLRDFKLVLWNIPACSVPANPGKVSDLTIDQSSNEALVDMLNDGWRIINHTLTPMASGGVLLSLFLERPVIVPDSL